MLVYRTKSNQALLTLLHLKVLLASPGIAAAKPFSQAAYPSSGYLELSIAPEASSASHCAWTDVNSGIWIVFFGNTYHFEGHDRSMNSTRCIVLRRAQGCCLAHARKGRAHGDKGSDASHIEDMLQLGEVQELDAVHATADFNQQTRAHYLYSWRIPISLTDMRHIFALRSLLPLLNQSCVRQHWHRREAGWSKSTFW
jgi:hypothetical protein